MQKIEVEITRKVLHNFEARVGRQYSSCHFLIVDIVIVVVVDVVLIDVVMIVVVVVGRGRDDSHWQASSCHFLIVVVVVTCSRCCHL